tara:strand:- start:368 stop:658 length:291 start_codon:yes stop_codon:yes gene_type:complete
MKDDIVRIIYDSIDEINKGQSQELQIEKSLETQLYGASGKIDSLGLVNLIVSIEQDIEDKFNKNLTIASEKAMSLKNSPFINVNSLAKYIETLLVE